MKDIKWRPFASEGQRAGRATVVARVWLWGLLVTVPIVFAGCSRATPQTAGGGEKAEAAPVTVAVAVRTNVPVQLHAIGHVAAFSTVAVQSRVDGVLERVYFQQGKTVKQGSLIFTIDPRPFQAALNQAKANLERDRALARYAEIEARRNADLLRQGIIPQDTSDQTRANADALEATVSGDEAAVTNAQLQLSFCSIRSPINGRVGVLNVNAGNVVKNLDTIIITINQTEPIYVDLSVPERELPRIRACLAAAGALRVAARVADHEENPPVGELTIINNAVDAKTGTILLRAVFPNQDERLWPGQFVNTVLTLTTLTNAVVVPSQSVQAGQQGTYIFVVKPDSTVEARPVEVGNQVGSVTVLRTGIQFGEQVVTGGQIRLAPGVKVRVEKQTTAPAVTQDGVPGISGSK
jgi:membrane fusion protein, multidrug efflux system